MKATIFLPLLSLLLALPLRAQAPAPARPAAPTPARPAAPAAPAAPVPGDSEDSEAPAVPVSPTIIPQQAEATLVYDEKNVEKAWILGASATAIAYREKEQAVDILQKRRSEIGSIYFHEIPALKAALDLYQGRRYAEAKVRLAEIKEKLKGIQELPNNPSTQAAFYELECMRRLNDLEGLAKALEGFRKEGLTRQHQLRQVDLYILWDALRTKSWPRLDSICKERIPEKLPGYQRAQVGYCHGMALEALGRPVEALNAYATAITADFGATEEITRQAALNSLRIHKNDPEVQLAIKLWGTPDENPNSQGRFRLEEAASLAAMYELTLGGGKPLAAEYKELLKYRSKDVDTSK